jgi:signal transduction histidine kinase
MRRAAGDKIIATPVSDLTVLRLVAHELRAHLTVLNGYASLLREDQRVRRDPERVDHALAEMSAHLATLNEICGQLVGAVDPQRERPGLPAAMAAVDLGGAAREALGMTEEVARRHRVRLRLDESGLGQQSVCGDRFQLVVAMRNLLDNACAHGPDGDAVTLEVGRSGGEVVIRARDQGPGLGRLGSGAFEPLRRGRVKKDEPGMGLGLSLVAEVARAHGGEVTWGCDEQGATIGLRFPDRALA